MTMFVRGGTTPATLPLSGGTETHYFTLGQLRPQQLYYCRTVKELQLPKLLEIKASTSTIPYLVSYSTLPMPLCSPAEAVLDLEILDYTTLIMTLEQSQ